ncbi:MAG TPA: DUF3422 domain-containing protein [Xanthobacteraceae bacterium]|nr:DUF3422 domain-containing protein [Xanthobacteraceae bacterium]
MSDTTPTDDYPTQPLAPHPLRAAILAEVHARPVFAISAPARILHFAFDTTGDRAGADRAHLLAFCEARGQAGPLPSEKQHRLVLGATVLRWEQHSEFTTYTWQMPSAAESPAFHPPADLLATPMRQIPQPGPLLVAIDLDLKPEAGEAAPDGGSFPYGRLFDQTSLAVAENSDAMALIATDFQVDAAGFVRILLIDRGMSGERTGALVQNVIDIETYRSFALLGLPEAQRLMPSIARAERRLAEVTDKMRTTEQLSDNHLLLDELMALAADVEAGAAASAFRFGASRAYDEIVTQRLHSIGERTVGGLPTWSSFLARRMAPAMRTCMATEARQANLAIRLTRAANLLRTRVDVERQQQNQELLKSMNARTRLQLRLQTTVEGLSVAAITYYVVGLFGYLVKAAAESGRLPLEPTYVTAAFVPVAALAIWLMVRRIRQKHIGRHE